MKTIYLLCLVVLPLLSGISSAAEKLNQPEKLIFHATPEAFDTLWDNLNVDTLKAELPDQAPGATFAVRRFRAGELTVICLINIGNQEQRQCSFYVEKHLNAYRNKNIGGVLEFRGEAAKAIAANFKLKELWHLTDNLLSPGKKIWRAGYAITKPEELFIWEFYYDGKEFFAHFSRVWHPEYYVFDMFERKSAALFDPRTDTFPRKTVVSSPSRRTDRDIDDLFLEGMRGTLFGDRRRQGMGN
jgi:hypothetical protein